MGKNTAIGRREPDIFEQISILFVRYLQRDMVERPRFAIAPGRGVEWHVAVFIGAAPPNLEAHYKRNSIVKSTQVDEVVSEATVTYKAAVSTSASAALVALRDQLVEALRLRLMSDLSVYERALGVPFVPSGAGQPLLPAKTDAEEDQGG